MNNENAACEVNARLLRENLTKKGKMGITQKYSFQKNAHCLTTAPDYDSK